MTVRVNKDSFNLREKLSELERPIGLKGSELMRSETAQEARDFISAGRKNLIFNGDMKVSQRGTSFTASTEYTLDRWRVSKGGISSLTTTQASSGLGIHPKSLKVQCTADASVVAGTDAWIRYAMEDKDFDSAINYPNTNKSISLSFWARANTAGQYSVCITSGDFGDRFIHAFTLNANSWEYKTVTIPAANQWGYTGGFGLRLYFDLGAGSNYQNSTLDQWIYSGSTYAASGNTRVCGVNGRTFEITGVQLEVGKNATEFEHRPYGEELALCQRYYWELGSYTNNNWAPIAIFLGQTSTRAFGSIPTPVTMRAHPNITFNDVNIYNGGSDIAVTNLFRYSQSNRDQEYNGLSWEANTASGLSTGTTYRINIKNASGTSGYIRLNAEL